MKKFFSLLLCIVVLSSACIPVSRAEEAQYFEYLEYPEEAITDFREEFLNRAVSDPGYEANQGYDETGMYVSPYWLCSINGTDVPVYAAMVYDEVLRHGVLQSYSYVYCEEITSGLDVTLTAGHTDIFSVCVLPEKAGIDASFADNDIVFEVRDFGMYTVLINEDELQYACTICVIRSGTDEDNIAEYKKQYGAEQVLVYDKAYYESDCLDFSGYKVIYFCKGAYFRANHLYDVGSDEEAAAITDKKVFIELTDKNDIIIDGYGTFDFNGIDRGELELFRMNNCSNCRISGLHFVNPNTWAVLAYGCTHVEFRNIFVTGYRTNSDGLNICNCSDVTVQNSCITTGDDCFSVKTVNDARKCENIVFSSCVARSTKARCFGITGEVEADISNVTFKNCAVTDRRPTWDNDRIGSLVIIVENGKGQIDNVTFEDIEIHSDRGRAINVTVYGEELKHCSLRNIRFKNITCNADMNAKICSDNNITAKEKISLFIYRLLTGIGINNRLTEKLYENTGANVVEVILDNVKYNSDVLNKKNYKKYISTAGNTSVVFD